MHSQLSRPLQTPPLSCSFKGFSSSYSFVFILLCPIHLLERRILSVINMNFAFYHNSSQDTPISLLFLPHPLSVHSFILQNSTTPPTLCLPLYLIPLYSIPLSFPCYIPITLKKKAFLFHSKSLQPTSPNSIIPYPYPASETSNPSFNPFNPSNFYAQPLSLLYNVPILTVKSPEELSA